MFGKPRMSMMRKRAAAAAKTAAAGSSSSSSSNATEGDPNADVNWWALTAALLDMLLFWSGFCEAPSKWTAKATLRFLLEKTLTHGQVLDLNLDEVAPAACTRNLTGGALCLCMEAYQNRAKGSAGHGDLVAALGALELQEKHTCPALRTKLGNLLSAIAKLVEENWEEWCDKDWQTGPNAWLTTATGKRRRADEHLKRFAMRKQGAGSAGSFAEAANSVKAKIIMRAWLDEELAAMRAEFLIRMKYQRTYSCVFDGVRFGNPGKERICIGMSGLDGPETVNVIPALQEIRACDTTLFQ
jgi:hypothetical protein